MVGNIGRRSATLAVLLMLLAMIFIAGTGENSVFGAPVVGSDVTYTTDADFDQGAFLNVTTGEPGEGLELSTTTTPFPFIWVAASARGTIVRIDVNTGVVLGEYKTAPTGFGLNPSRTTVDLFGNVWTGNRAEQGFIGPTRHGSVVKVGLTIGGTRTNGDSTPNPVGNYLAPPYTYNTCLDRDSDGLIKTSRGLLDIRPWVNATDGAGSTDGAPHIAKVQDADDECILIFQRTPGADAVRHLSVDANNDVWIGGYPFALRMFHKLDETTGAILASFNSAIYGCGGYGGLIDGNGIMWSASLSQHKLLRYDIGAGTGTCVSVPNSYGLGIDTNGDIWNSRWTHNAIKKLTPAGGTIFDVPTGSANNRGVAVTPADNNVWTASSGSHGVSRLSNAGAVLGFIPTGITPTGVAVDSNGKVWVTNRDSNNVSRIDPTVGAFGVVDLTVPLGAGAGPYNYSDMTGQIAVGSTSAQGMWNIVQDSGAAGTEWGIVSWNNEPEGEEPGGSSIMVEVRTSDTEAGLAGESFFEVSNGVQFSSFGQFIEVRATLKAGSTPVLSDISVSTGGPTCKGVAATIVGTDEGEFIWGTNGPDVIVGLGGDDTIEGLGGDDIICAGEGDDLVDGNDGDDLIFGGPGDDELWGDAGNDIIWGSHGMDRILGNGGDDEIHGGPDMDDIDGNNGDDTIWGDGGDDWISGGKHNDEIYGGPGEDSLDGNRGNDFIDGGEDADEIYGGPGNDKIKAGGGNDFVDGETGDDDISGGEGDDELVGNRGNDTIFGDAGEDDISGSQGNDAIDGGDNDDYLDGGNGNDDIDGGNGDDFLGGYDGNDKLFGGPGEDVVEGHGGDDKIAGGADLDSLDGGWQVTEDTCEDDGADSLVNCENIV